MPLTSTNLRSRPDLGREQGFAREYGTLPAHPDHGAVDKRDHAAVARADSAGHTGLKAEPRLRIGHLHAHPADRLRHRRRSADGQPISGVQFAPKAVGDLLGPTQAAVLGDDLKPARQPAMLQSRDRLRDWSSPRGLSPIPKTEQDEDLPTPKPRQQQGEWRRPYASSHHDEPSATSIKSFSVEPVPQGSEDPQLFVFAKPT